MDALAVAESIEGDYELRTLRIPALHTVALWLLPLARQRDKA